MSVEASSWVWKHSPYRDATLIVHLAIADVVNDTHHNECWMTRDALAVKAHTSPTTVSRAVKQMLDDGLLTVLERGGGRGKASRYRFEMPLSTALWTSGETSSDCARFVEPKPTQMSRETLSSARPIGRTQLTQETKGADPKIGQLRAPDAGCTRCGGSGTVYAAGAGVDALCPCTTEPDYKPAPARATRPPEGFGLPAQRRSSST